MLPVSRLRILLRVATVALLLLLAWGAIAGGLRQLPASRTAGQGVETAVQLVCGFLTLLVVVTCFARREWARSARIAWAASLVTAAGLSPLVWGPPMPLVALLFAAAAALLALAVGWVLRRTG